MRTSRRRLVGGWMSWESSMPWGEFEKYFGYITIGEIP